MTWTKISQSDMYKFEVGAAVEGKYVSCELNQGPKKNSAVHTVKDKDGKDIKFWGSTVLDGKLEEVQNRFGFGTLIQVVYVGKKKGKTGTEYNDYEVYTDAGDSEGDVVPVEDQPKIDDSNLPF